LKEAARVNIAVVRNRDAAGVINHFGQPSPEKYGRRSVQAVLDALRAGGHSARVFEGDMTLLDLLREYMPPDPSSGRPTGLVFNMSYGSQGEARYSQVPILLEMAGVPYTGSGPRSHAVCLDKALTKLLIREAGIATPEFCLISRPDEIEKAAGLRFPLVVKPRFESTSYGLAFVESRSELAAAAGRIITEFRQDALVEEYIDGREVAVALLGNESMAALPLVELDFGARSVRMMTGSDKFHKTVDEPQKVCPAPLDPATAHNLREISVGVFHACQCRDYARVDIRLDREGRPFVLEINSMASLGQGGAYVTAARAAGHDFNELVTQIVDVAHARHFGTPAPRGESCPDRQMSVELPANELQ
jgi:D-alanine-D-alanine ligase